MPNSGWTATIAAVRGEQPESKGGTGATPRDPIGVLRFALGALVKIQTTWNFLEAYVADPESAAQLFLRLALTVARSVTGRYGLRIDEIDDFCQEAFTRAVTDDFSALRRTDREANLTGWIRGVIVNLARSSIRDHVRSRGTGRPPGMASVSARREFCRLNRQARFARLSLPCIEQLTHGQREAFDLFLAGLEYAAIGLLLRIRWDTARELINRAWCALVRLPQKRDDLLWLRLPAASSGVHAGLSRDDRTLYDHWQSGSSRAEIGGELSITADAVHSRLKRLRARISTQPAALAPSSSRPTNFRLEHRDCAWCRV